MRSPINYLLCCLIIPVTVYSQKSDNSLKYLGQNPPSLVPEVFAPGLISKNTESEFGSVFNAQATEFFYGVDKNGRTEIRYTYLLENRWSAPETILAHENYGFNDPFLSPDENRLYFISEKALSGHEAKQDHDIWYVERTGDNWSEPINAGPNINSDRNEYYMSFTTSGTMYFSSNKRTEDANKNGFDIYSSRSIDGVFQEAINLGGSINTAAYEADVFVDPEERYVIFCAKRQDGLGRGDLYISFKNNEGKWSKSINMGDKINTENHELCPFVTRDGKFLFYTSNQDIYWVSASLIDELKEK